MRLKKRSFADRYPFYRTKDTHDYIKRLNDAANPSRKKREIFEENVQDTLEYLLRLFTDLLIILHFLNNFLMYIRRERRMNFYGVPYKLVKCIVIIHRREIRFANHIVLTSTDRTCIFCGDKILLRQWSFLGTNCGAPHAVEGVLVSYRAGSIYRPPSRDEGEPRAVFWYHLIASGRCAPVFPSLSPPSCFYPSRLTLLSLPFFSAFPLSLSLSLLYFMDSSPPRPRASYVCHNASIPKRRLVIRARRFSNTIIIRKLYR